MQNARGVYGLDPVIEVSELWVQGIFAHNECLK